MQQQLDERNKIKLIIKKSRPQHKLHFDLLEKYRFSVK